MPARPSPTRRPAARLALALAALTLPLAACATTDGGESATASPSATAALSLADGWVKAVDSGMTAAFGVLENSSEAPITLVSAQTDAAAMVELHETVEDGSGAMVMRPVDGGFVVPAGGTHELAPGGDHIMLMGVTDPIEPGEDVTIVLTTDDGGTLTVSLPARSFSGAEESYDGGTSGDDMGDGGMSGDDMSGTSTPTP